jgi:hypothetical protein
MTVLLAFALAQASATVPPPPADWTTLPLARLDRPGGVTYSDTIPVLRLAEQRRECRAGIGPMASSEQESNIRMVGLRLDLILLVAPDGQLLNILAAPGPCDAIRNYARALINTRYHGRLRPPTGPAPAWYLVRLGFRWEP